VSTWDLVLVAVMWIAVKFLNGRLTEVPFQFLSTTQVLFVIRIETRGQKLKLLNHRGLKGI
jgi:hypothetical protein